MTDSKKTEFYKQPKLPNRKKRLRINEEKILALKHGGNYLQ